jgi:hypothetical protein
LDLVGFDNRVVIGPGLFKAVREEFDGGCPLATPDQKADRSRTESTDHPKNIFHRVAPYCVDSDPLVNTMQADGLDAGKGCRVDWRGWVRMAFGVVVFAGAAFTVGEERLHF